MTAERYFAKVRRHARRHRWVIGAARWRAVGCLCGCSGDGLAQWQNPECPFHGAG